MQRQPIGKFISALAFLSAVGAALGSSPASGGPVYAAREAAEVAFVEDLNGRIVAFSQASRSCLTCSTRSTTEHR